MAVLGATGKRCQKVEAVTKIGIVDARSRLSAIRIRMREIGLI
jgi:hypothetical protein